jgi:hypothetical protein
LGADASTAGRAEPSGNGGVDNAKGSRIGFDWGLGDAAPGGNGFSSTADVLVGLGIDLFTDGIAEPRVNAAEELAGGSGIASAC